MVEGTFAPIVRACVLTVAVSRDGIAVNVFGTCTTTDIQIESAPACSVDSCCRSAGSLAAGFRRLGTGIDAQGVLASSKWYQCSDFELPALDR